MFTSDIKQHTNYENKFIALYYILISGNGMSHLSYARIFILVKHLKIMFAFLVCPSPCPFDLHCASFYGR